MSRSASGRRSMMLPNTAFPSMSPLAASSADGALPDRLDQLRPDLDEARALQQAPHRRRVVQAVGHRVELGRISGEERGDGLVGDPADGVSLHGVPHAEEVRPLGPEDPVRLPHAGRLVREEHEPELAHHRVEGAVGKGQACPVRLAPLECRAPGEPGLCAGDHRLVEVRGDQGAAAGEAPDEALGDDAGPAGHLEHPGSGRHRQPRGQVVGVAVEEEGPEVPVVVGRDRAHERRVLLRHGPLPTASRRRT